MNAIDQIKERLKKHPRIRFLATEMSITIPPKSEDGFEVSFHVKGNEYTVYFEGWHDHFGSLHEAINCFGFGLSPECRIKVDIRGEHPYRWTCEVLQDGQWVKSGTTGLMFYPLWRRHRVKYLRNNWLPGPDPLANQDGRPS